ncbi:adenylate/guanylate cyclase domain-containing protein, partial [Candidatus Parcubacteria bacterium]
MGPITDYEELRRRRELQAERTSQLINAILLSALILGAYFITRFGNTDFRLPRMWWTFMIVGAVVSLGIYVVITKVAAYAPNRKYLMTVWDALIITGAFYGLDGEIGPNTFALVALPAFVLLIASAALRLSPGPVMLSGGLSLVSYLSLFARQATPEIRLAIFLEGSMLLVATTLTAHRMVKETLGLIRESVLRTRLSRFLPARVVDEITQKPTLLEQQTRCLVATIMFVDIRGFTAMSEGKPPPQVLSIVRAFHQQVSIRVSEKGGTVLAYEGDGVMAVFGLHD